MIYYFLYSARFRSFTFFSASNPAIDLGGMLDENKTDIYALLPSEYVPVTIKITPNSWKPEMLDEAGLKFPLIVKPNIGFKGYKVKMVNDIKALHTFLSYQDESREWLIQEFIDLKREYSLLYWKYPDGNDCGISSLIEKIYPYVIGDGVHDLKTLLRRYANPFLDKEDLTKRFEHRWNEVPEDGGKIILDVIGNYSRGSKFLSLMECIDQPLIDATKIFFEDVEGMDFFRLDFKADSLEDYIDGRFKILEINGAKSEPLHIYDPKFSFSERFNILKMHWKIMSDIVQYRKKNSNYRFPTTSYGLKSLFSIKKLVK
jgi:predicted ATP-grasp superfamily ATP-dependent carboligase